MKIIDKQAPWNEKVNFVDENNVFLGYDTSQQCCESAGWFIADNPCEDIVECDVPDVDGFVFDTSYFKGGIGCASLDEGSMVIFRIVKGEREKFIHLYNCHNGYYAHGFEFVVDGVKIHAASL